MWTRRTYWRMVVVVWVAVAGRVWGAEATLRVRAGEVGAHAIPAYVTGKFAEHLYYNIYNGMCAEIVRNPTFADFLFAAGQGPDGRPRWLSEEEKIVAEIRRGARRFRWPEEAVEKLVESRADALAHWWVRVGQRKAVKVSPDAGPYGGRAQRIETSAAGEGIGQWMHLPLHRMRKFEFQVVVRSANLTSVVVGLEEARAEVKGVSRKWGSFRGMLEVSEKAAADGVYQLTVTTPGAGQIVVERVLLWPADHVKGADADVVRMLKESRLPILRWPGGNFVSGYRWEDGVGPMEKRPTHPNWAWGGVEPNLFGTEEFIAFCRAVGCEPMICVNGGDGTPEEAARWVEYCNGAVTTPMGAKRAANGHPEPYNVRHWEVGNELWGKWQVHWTTATGNVDRYREFSEAMLKADPTIKLYACGAPVLWGREWNVTLFKGAADILRCTTDHPLIGGNVSAGTEPLDVYRDFMAVPDILEKKWRQMRGAMVDAGVKEPRLAITELQLFAHIAGDNVGERKLTRENLVTPATQAEALYDTLIYHSCVRLGSFVEMVTHSATVNHGGGLRKERERVYANPCYYAQSAFAAFAGARVVGVEIGCDAEKSPFVLPEIKGEGPEFSYRSVAALAAIDRGGDLLISIVNRGTRGAVNLRIEIEGFTPGAGKAEVWRLSAEAPWAVNTVDEPEKVRPVVSEVEVKENRLVVEMPMYAVMRVRIAK